jgi:dTDP-4-dehydrorhamnose reductase
MKILILGKNGMMGSMLDYVISTSKTHTSEALDRTQFNALTDSLDNLYNFASAGEEVCVVNCIGAIPQRKYSNEEYIFLNEKFPHALASHCQSLGWYLIHLSTNCVFSGQKGSVTEVDIPDATDVYGITKLKGEPSYGLTIRSSIIGPEKGTAFGLMEWFLHANVAVAGYVDVLWNGITTLELSRKILQMIDSRDLNTKLIHIYSSHHVSKYNVLNFLSGIFDHNIAVVPKSVGQQDCTLSSVKTVPCKHIYEQIRDLAEIMGDYRFFTTSGSAL